MATINNIGFIGFGNLAQSIWAGSKDFLLNETRSISCFKPSQTNLPNDIQYKSLDEVLNESDIIVLALKPQQVSSISKNLKKIDWHSKCLVSLLAGTPSAYFKRELPSLTHFLRVMPNTCAKIKESMTVISLLDTCDHDYLNFITDLFNGVGETLIIDESQMNFCTGLAGSGPAFVYEIAKNLQDLCIEQGLSHDDAQLLTSQLFKGSSSMMGKENLSDMIKAISSPNGTTVRGLDTLRDLSIGKGLQKVVLAAKKRSEELSNESLGE